MISNREKHSIKLAKSMQFLAGGALVLMLACVSVQPAQADADPRLVKLEMKFFEHDYPKDDVQTRLQRLEKLVFGDAQTGDVQSRLQHLVSAVPNLEAVPSAQSTTEPSPAPTARSTPAAPPPARGRQSQPASDVAESEEHISGSSQYPQVSAMEVKLYHHDYASDPIAKRLARLETTVYGKPSDSNDLSERVDRLKSRTGVDLAASPPPGTDWADDDDMAPHGGGDITYVPAETTPFAPGRVPATNLGGSPAATRGSGTYGGRTSSSYSDADADLSGNYGFHPPSGDRMPPPAPDVVHGQPGLGLSQQVAVLENQVFRKTYSNDPLPARINRLEATVFHAQGQSSNLSLPERVSRLRDVLGSADTQAPSRKRVAQKRSSDDDFDDPQMPPMAPPRSGLSKIIGGLGNLITGGGMMTGSAYPMGSNLVTDPRTGMLMDMYSGNIIDPRTGAVVGNQTTGVTSGTFGALPYTGGFNSGLSPMGTYGTGMRFGTGFGGSRFGGLGFGTGIGTMGPGFGGMGIWP